ncbi:MAG TPA: molybdenum ABC transporter ATP-binding protein [Candidatus Binatia bacterium]|nr:molybdenum ABC transporter ATP-binding protein [Candidatus Binatia bacterium]
MLLRCRIPLATFELDVDVSFDSRVTAIFGPSGSGKTTLLDAIAGLREITAGEIEMFGKTLFSSAPRINLPPQRRNLGYVPQEGALFPHLSVRRNILFGSERTTQDAGEKTMSLEHVVEILEIGHLLDRSVTELSGGEAQRVALARAILSRPQLLLLDEPLAALDVGLKERILPYLARVRDEFAIPMIYVTHNVTEVLTLADWVLVIRQGRLVAQGPPSETLTSSRALRAMPEEELENVFTVEFIDADRATGRSRVRLSSGAEIFVPYVPPPARRDFQVRVRADDILIGTHRPEGISAANILPGTVRAVEILDDQSLVRVDAGELFCVRVTAGAVTRLALGAGSAVFLIIKTRSFQLL